MIDLSKVSIRFKVTDPQTRKTKAFFISVPGARKPAWEVTFRGGFRQIEPNGNQSSTG